MNLLVVTPKSEMENAEAEAELCKKNGGGIYFRRFPLERFPRKVEKGDKIFYAEAGYIRGFAEVSWQGIVTAGVPCALTGTIWPQGYYFVMDAKTWKWIRPIPIKSFRGIRYFDGEYEVVGGWLDPKPFPEVLPRNDSCELGKDSQREGSLG